MPRINPVTDPEDKAKELLDLVQQKYGMQPNMLKTLAHSPAALQSYLEFGNAMESSQLSPTLREQIALTVSGINQCDYCSAAHMAIGKMTGGDESELHKSLLGQSSDPKAQAALTFAKLIVETQANIADSDLETIRNAGYSDSEIIEIFATVAMTLFSNYFNHITEPDVDFPPVIIP